MTVAIIDTIRLLIAVFASYFPTVAISGFFAALVAKKLGDDTAANQGFLTLNPIDHMRPFGLLVLLVSMVIRLPFIIAFGQHIPINERYIAMPFRKAKYLLALLARPFANLMLSCLAIFSWIVFWKTIGQPYGIDQNYPALFASMQLLYLVFRGMNIFSLMLELIFALVEFIMSIIFPNINEESFFVIFVIQINLLLLACYFVAPYLQHGVYVIELLFGRLITVMIG